MLSYAYVTRAIVCRAWLLLPALWFPALAQTQPERGLIIERLEKRVEWRKS